VGYNIFVHSSLFDDQEELRITINTKNMIGTGRENLYSDE
jgi:hypothetical protein